jgi:hypothetical protein
MTSIPHMSATDEQHLADAGKHPYEGHEAWCRAKDRSEGKPLNMRIADGLAEGHADERSASITEAEINLEFWRESEHWWSENLKWWSDAARATEYRSAYVAECRGRASKSHDNARAAKVKWMKALIDAGGYVNAVPPQYAHPGDERFAADIGAKVADFTPEDRLDQESVKRDLDTAEPSHELNLTGEDHAYNGFVE